MNELDDHEFLRRLLGRDLSEVDGPGDDCARLPVTDAALWATADMLVEGRHYDETATTRDLARKLVHRSFSDLAAMGAWPTRVLASFAFGPGWDAARRQEFYREIDACVRARDARWVGGDLAASGGASVFHLVALGTADAAVPRDGLRPRDALLVSGALGGSLESARHLRFEPRLEFARHLVRHHAVHAMIDISDGLLLDLERLLSASSRSFGATLGAALDEAAIPCHADIASDRDALEAALTDGEDHELLFAVGPEAVEAILGDSKLAGARRIGTVDETAGIRTRCEEGRRTRRAGRGYVHDFESHGDPEQTRDRE